MLGEITLTGLTSQGAISNQLHSWRVGQILEAVVLSRSAAERLQLRIGNTQLEARSQAPIQAGDRILLKVLSAGTTPTLQVVPATVASGGASELVSQALRQLLPRQLPTEKVLNNLLAILEGGPDRKTPGREQANELPVRTRSLIETLLARIPQGNKLADHARLRQLVQESGLFSEQRQAQTASGAEARPTDIKQALVQLARQLAVQKPAAGDPPTTARAPVNAQGQTAAPATAITSTPLSANRGEHGERPAAASQPAVAAPKPVLAAKPDAPQLPVEVSRHLQKSLAPGQQSQTGNQGQLQAVTVQDLQRLVEGAVARIVSQQAQSLPQPGQDAVRWVFELPYRQGDEFHSMPMVIEREASGDDSAELEPGWQVELAFELAELGPIQARVLLRGDKVSASLWAQRDDTAQLADAELPVLEAALEGSGLSVGALVCRQGQHNASQHLVPNSSSSLLDCRI